VEAVSFALSPKVSGAGPRRYLRVGKSLDLGACAQSRKPDQLSKITGSSAELLVFRSVEPPLTMRTLKFLKGHLRGQERVSDLLIGLHQLGAFLIPPIGWICGLTRFNPATVDGQTLRE
jgi:hypothetical protein